MDQSRSSRSSLLLARASDEVLRFRLLLEDNDDVWELMILDGRVGVIDRVTVWSGVKAEANGIITKTIETAAILHGRRKKGVVDE